MVKRTSFENAECPIARSLDAIGDWWSMLIIRDALLGVRRFGEFQKNLGLAKNILTVRLRALVDQGILKMAPASDGSAYQEYVLTPKGRGVFPVLVALRQWSEEFGEQPDEIATMLVDKRKRPAGSQARTAFPGRPAADRRRYRAEATIRQARRQPRATSSCKARQLHDSLRLLRSRRRSSASSCAMSSRWLSISSSWRRASLDQFGNGFRDEGRGLVRAALPCCSSVRDRRLLTRSFALPAAPCLAQKICIQSHAVLCENNPFGSATLGRISQLFRYKSDPARPSFNICRFDRGRLTTHVRVETAGREFSRNQPLFSP